MPYSSLVAKEIFQVELFGFIFIIKKLYNFVKESLENGGVNCPKPHHSNVTNILKFVFLKSFFTVHLATLL